MLFAEPPGTLLPTGGLDHGHKGYNLALAIEALSQGLSGHGRADPLTDWGASVYVQVIDPAAFGGAADFLRQTGCLAGGLPQQSAGARGRRRCACRASRASPASARRCARASSSIPASWTRSRPWAEQARRRRAPEPDRA